MPETPGASPVSQEEENARDEEDPGEVGTRFTTKGSGWSGRDKDDSE